MKTESPSFSPVFLGSVLPIVLVGGRSRRFGRDKLREPWGECGRILVQQPIDALRAVFGRRVMLIGECDPSIIPFADGMLTDSYPGIGPIGGILSALMQHPGSICVLAGDMPFFGKSELSRVLLAAQQNPDALAIIASTDRLHPCAGVYTRHARQCFESSVSRGNYRLLSALDPARIITVPVPPEAAVNVNTAGDVRPADSPRCSK